MDRIVRFTVFDGVARGSSNISLSLQSVDDNPPQVSYQPLVCTWGLLITTFLLQITVGQDPARVPELEGVGVTTVNLSDADIHNQT